MCEGRDLRTPIPGRERLGVGGGLAILPVLYKRCRIVCIDPPLTPSFQGGEKEAAYV